MTAKWWRPSMLESTRIARNILNLSWRHAWRSRRRTLIIVFCVMLGNLVLIFQLAQGRGQEHAFMYSMIHSVSGHLEIARPNKDGVLSMFEAKIQDASPLPDFDKLAGILRTIPHVTAFAPRVRFGAMFSRDEDTWGGFVIGAQPDQERVVCDALKLSAGRFVTSGSREIVISETMAQDQGLHLGDNVTLLTSTTTRSFNAMEFRIVGLLAGTGLSRFFSRLSYIPIDQAQQLIALDDGRAYEGVVLLDDDANTDAAATALRKALDANRFDDVKVMTWRELGGIFTGILDLGAAFRAVMAAFLGLVLLVLIFNSFSVYVLERGKEIATLMAIGMKKGELALLFVAESVWITLLGSSIGLLIGGGIAWWLGRVGIPAFNQALEYAFAGERLYPILAASDVAALMLVSCLIALAAALQPVRRALKQEASVSLD